LNPRIDSVLRTFALRVRSLRAPIFSDELPCLQCWHAVRASLSPSVGQCRGHVDEE